MNRPQIMDYDTWFGVAGMCVVRKEEIVAAQFYPGILKLSLLLRGQPTHYPEFDARELGTDLWKDVMEQFKELSYVPEGP